MDGPNDELIAVMEMRQKIIGYWARLSPAKRRTWPRSHGIDPKDLRHYMNGDPHQIPTAKAAELVNAIKLAKREKRESKVRARANPGPIAAGKAA